MTEAKGKKPAKPAKSAKSAKPADAGKVATWDGKKTGSATLDGSSLGGGERIKRRLIRSAVRMYEANRRQGNASTKTRGQTAYTTRKPYRQKGTGNARRGDFNSPLLRGGGVIFGPHPRNFGFSIPRKALREALRSALVGKLRDSEICTILSAPFGEPSTKTAARALSELGCAGSAVVVLPGDQPAVWKSFRNLPRVSVVRASDLNARQVLAHDRAVFVDDAWDVLMGRLGKAKVEAAS